MNAAGPDRETFPSQAQYGRDLWRNLHLLVQPLSFLATVLSSAGATKFERLLNQMEGLELPLPTPAVLTFSRLLSHPAAMTIGALLVIVLCFLVKKGVLDRILIPLIVFNLMWAVTYPMLVTMTVYLPITRLHS